MKIIVGGLYHESNTFNPILTTKKDFTLYEGESMLSKVASTEVFKEAGAAVIPSIYASALPSGIVTEKAYRFFADKILDVIVNESDVDGIWLHLHGSMTVQNIGSCEVQLLKEIRHMIGYDIPISLTLDIHANNDDNLYKYANIIRSYRSVPHIDQAETEKITAELLIKNIKDNVKIKPIFKRLPMIICGETAIGSSDPLKSIFKKLDEIEETPGIATASFFIGFSWADTENTASSLVVVPESEQYVTLAKEKADELARYLYDRRHEFKFESLALKPKEAIDKALTIERKPVFISDSGDNTTGGGVGASTVFLENLLEYNNTEGKRICFAAIYDEDAYDYCAKYPVGSNISFSVGNKIDEHSNNISINGMLKTKGDLMGFLGFTTEKVGEVCTVSVGNLDIVIANKAYSFISINHFDAAGLNYKDYDIIVVKQGYLFAELDNISKFHILALTPGATYQLITELDYEKIPRPIFPLDE